MINPSDLKPNVQRVWLKTICKELSELVDVADYLNDDVVQGILETITAHLDELDGYDMFGTEGWRRNFGLED